MLSGCSLRDMLKPERVASVVRDVTFVTVGFAVLGFQRAQVLRREFERSLPDRAR